MQVKELITRIYSSRQLQDFLTTFICEMVGVKSVPIEFGIDGRHSWVKIKDTVELDIKSKEETTAENQF